jgi:uncharacterized protein YbjT (DUF2867 family)
VSPTSTWSRGPFSYSGSRIAQLLIDSGREVRTLTHHPDREHPLRARIQAARYRFDDPAALAGSLEGITTIYDTYWVRFERGRTTFADAVANSRALFEAARRSGVARIVHVSIANPSIDSPLPYYRGKALVEQALAAVGVSYAIVRPTFFFGGGRDILANNIAWILRRMPLVGRQDDVAHDEAECARERRHRGGRCVPGWAYVDRQRREWLERVPRTTSCPVRPRP